MSYLNSILGSVRIFIISNILCGSYSKNSLKPFPPCPLSTNRFINANYQLSYKIQLIQLQ